MDFPGISSISIYNRNLNAPSNFLLQAIESLMLEHRLDIPFMLNKMCKDAMVTEDFIRQTSEYPTLAPCNEVSYSLESANVVTMIDLVITKKFFVLMTKATKHRY